MQRLQKVLRVNAPADCLDVHWWEVEQANARTVARRPELAIEPHERYVRIDIHRGYDWPVDINVMDELERHGAITCTHCDGHGGYNLRLSVLCGYHWAVCWRCAGYGKVKP
jgi:hypothetical protein